MLTRGLLFILKFNLPKIYPITDVRRSALSHAAQVEKLIAGGAKIVQLREKHYAPRDFYLFSEQALKIARRHGVKILINDRVDFALALKADGVHLGQNDLPPIEARRILGETAIIGFSTHTVEQAVAAAQMPIDYLAAGPIFDTATKENPDETVGLDGLKKIRDAVGDFPLVAIGGINLQNFRDVLNAGANSAAVIGDLLDSDEDISQRLRRFLNGG